MAKTKDKAFALFALHKEPSSPEVKALGIKSGTRWNYYNQWKKLGEPNPDVSAAELGVVPQKATKREKRVSDKVTLPGGAVIGSYKPDEAIVKPVVPSEGEATEQPEPESGEPKIPINLGGDHDRPSILGEVVGTGIPVTVVLSLKSLSFWEIAHSIAPGLTLDNFIDDCVEDFFKGRGKDLGLVEIGDAR